MLALYLSLLTAPALAEDFVPVGNWPGMVGPQSPNWDLETLYLEREYERGLELAKERVAANPNDTDLYWHIARFMFEIGERFDRTDKSIDKLGFYKEMLAWCDKGLAIAPGHPHIRFARGIALGRLGTTRGVLASLFSAQDIEQDWTATIASGLQYATPNGQEILPCDAYQALGIFYRLVPEWWIVGVIAGTKGDLQKSVDYLERASRCAPDTIRNLKELGVSQVCLGQNRDLPEMIEKGKGNLEKMLTLEPRNPTEFTDLKHGKMLLADLSLACEYSRDGQQDLDQSKLEQP